MDIGVVVGGGLPGIVSALVLKEHVSRVVLIEKNTFLGGVYRKKQGEKGQVYETGPCCIEPFLSSSLNEKLLKPSWKETWNRFSYPIIGNFFNGVLTEKTSFIDCRSLDPKVYYMALGEMIAACEQPCRNENLEQVLTTKFGKTLTQTLFAPIVSKIFNGTPIWEIHPLAEDLFGFSKIIAFSPKTTKELFRSPIFSSKLSAGVGEYSNEIFFPKWGGVQSWIQLLEEELRSKGIEIFTQESIVKASYEGEMLTEIQTSSGNKFLPSCLIWTEDPGELLEIAVGEINRVPSKTHEAVLVDFVFDLPPLTDMHWLWCFDPKLLVTKVIFFSNLEEDSCLESGRHRVRLTLSADRFGKEAYYLKAAREELKKLHLFDPSAKILEENLIHFSTPFAIPTTELISEMQDNACKISKKWKNVISGGHLNGFESSPQKAAEHLYATLNELLSGKKKLEEIEIPI